MPSWSIHCVIAKKVNEYLKLDENTFLLGNILPDVDDEINEYGSYFSHYYGTLRCSGCQGEELPDIQRFLKKYKDNIDNPIMMGYYCHLLTDYYFNDYAYSKYWLMNKNGDVIGVKTHDGKEILAPYCKRQTIKKQDFIKFDRELYDLGVVTYPIYNSSLIDDVGSTPLNFIDSKDIELVFKKIPYFLKKAKESSHEYTIFSKDELEKLTNDATCFVMNKLKELKMIKGSIK
jgi:hypothetical protein